MKSCMLPVAFHAPVFAAAPFPLTESSALHGLRQRSILPVSANRIEDTHHQPSMLFGFLAAANPPMLGLATLPAIAVTTAKAVIANTNA